MSNTVHVALQDANANDNLFGGSLLGSSTLKNVTGATKANPCVVTVVGHSRKVGDWIYLGSIGGMTQLSGQYWKITGTPDADHIEINTDSTGYGTYTSGGYMYPYATSKTNPCYVRVANHGFVVGQPVYLYGITGMTELNNNTYTVVSVEGQDTFGINVDSTSFGTYNGTNAGTAKLFNKYVQNITQANPAVVTSGNHGLVNGSRLILKNIGGMTELNDKVFTAQNVTTNTFELQGIDSTGYTAFTSGGEIHWMRATIATAINDIYDGDTIKVEKTTAATTINPGITFTWTNNSNIVTTSSTPTGIATDDIIGFSTSTGNGNKYTYHLVASVAGTTITLRSRAYLGESTATLNELGCKKVVPVATGTSANHIGYLNKNASLIGGWSFNNNAVPVRDDETWIKHAFTPSISTNLGLFASGAGASITYMNSTLAYHTFDAIGTGSELGYCTSIGSYYLALKSTSTTTNLHDCIFTGTYGTYDTAWIHTTNVGANVYFISNTAASTAAVRRTGGNTIHTGTVYVRCSARGMWANGSGSVFKDIDARFCTNGIHADSSSIGSKFENCNVSDCTYGIYMGTGVYGTEIYNNDINYCTTYGIYITQCSNVIVRENRLGINGQNIYRDTYSSNIKLFNNVHTAPVTYAVNRGAIATDPMVIIGDTIDESSRFKAINIYASSYNLQSPQYKLYNAFGQSGQYFANHQILLVSGASPYIEFQFNSTFTNNYYPYKVVSSFTKEGVGKTITFQMNAPVALSVLELTPVIKLNGTIVQTESAITSVSTGSTWDEHVINIDGLDVDQEGELTVEFLITSGSGVLRVKVISFEDA